ncbi:leucyl aminopeptidase [Roseinatronobacter alkalisoli]|uniref:Probable cytosol aminopeptidase n=1 Tax=Roseinatronobacter alkalisoli TaxID=3028235 RepID=A0ABT5T8Q6_9RHOB|nr:leucyl aminopeptidase [Roseinatronobacter sp. HJB301]MDD7970308.1 leucyl aminopeptidase [Roseinatronobacter sp. HJB301]
MPTPESPGPASRPATGPLSPEFLPFDLDDIVAHSGHVTVFADIDARLPRAARRADKLTRGAVSRAVGSADFAALEPGSGLVLKWPTGMQAEALQIIRLNRRADRAALRKAGLSIGKALSKSPALICADSMPLPDMLQAAALRAYQYQAQKSAPKPDLGPLSVMVRDLDKAADCADALALARAVHLTRDLVNAPANVLTTTSFANQINDMQALGLKVEILDEDDLNRLGLRAMLAVGQGSDSPSKLAILHWQGAQGAPLAIVGKGVMFDTGGISIKPGAGMEEMTMDMGGAAVTVGLMQALAERKARANVVGLVGLAENMPDGRAQRPGDVVQSMKGDMIEVINTDAEGRMVLADVLWYAQDRFAPRAVIDLATLTGAIIVALGHDKAGVFANDDALANAFLKAADHMGEGAWRMPLDPCYDKLISSRIGDVKNSGGRAAGSITAAQFLQRFIKPGTPWMHLDIAGVALPKTESAHAPKGASGWGVLALDALIRATFEDG